MKFDKVIVTDFDGTITKHDFYLLAIERLLPHDTHDHWSDYREGRITHFEGLRRYFSDIRATEDDVLKIVGKMRPDKLLKRSVDNLRSAGWDVVIASAGCSWYIDLLLKQSNVDIEVHANPGCFVEGQGLLMREPKDSPFYSSELGIDKALLVRTMLEQHKSVAYAGDGLPDILPSKLVEDDLRFARGALAEALRVEQIPYRPFSSWSEIADALVNY